MTDQVLTVTQSEQGLAIQGPLVEKLTGRWSARPVDDRRILLSIDDGQPATGPIAGAVACPVHVFKDFLLALMRTAWSGCLFIDTGFGIKRIFLAKGALAFASSNVIDDRLGEVVYREAKITLEQHVNSAAQVTKVAKFGQVLLNNGIFTNIELWDALKLQTKQILRSLFMVENVFVELEPGAAPVTEVVFEESAEETISECYGYGCAFRAFLSRLRAESEVELLVPKEEIERHYAPGTFVGDLLLLISEQGNVQELLNTSKLIDSYTIAALSMLVNLGLCRITPDIEPERKQSAEMAPLKARFDTYAYVLQGVKKAFTDTAKPFPFADLRRFTASLNPEGFPSLFLDAQGGLGRDCAAGIFSQCAANPARIAYFSKAVESLVQFLLQIAGDNLDLQTARRIRQEYRSIAL